MTKHIVSDQYLERPNQTRLEQLKCIVTVYNRLGLINAWRVIT